MKQFNTIEEMHNAFVYAPGEAFYAESVIVGNHTYAPSPVALTEAGLPLVVMVSSDINQPPITLQWRRAGTAFVPDAARQSTTPMPVAESTEVPSCELLEHRASIAGASIQVKIDESLTQPVLHISSTQFESGPRDPESCLPHMGKLTLNESSVFVYEDSSTTELIIPTIILDSLDGVALHDVRVKLEHNKCTHLAIPPSVLNRRS